MMRNMLFSALFISLPLAVSAQEAQEAAPAEVAAPAPTTAPAVPPSGAPTTAPGEATTVSMTDEVAAVTATGDAPPATYGAPAAEPITGWSRGKRAPMYVNVMMLGGFFVEDSDNRLTIRDSRTLEGIGGVFRLGAVIDTQNRIGVRLQTFVRPTKKILRTEPLAPGASEWGSANYLHAGPEYLYTCPKGFYAGGSLGLGMAMTAKTLDDHHEDEDFDNLEHAAAGFSGILSVGYEWRFSKWFALNAEAYGGLFRGVDDDEKGMTNVHFGLGMGAGF
jgi:hypothetical protein